MSQMDSTSIGMIVALIVLIAMSAYFSATETAFTSVSDYCVIPMQDYLDLGAEARMNFPGTLSVSNWTWRAKDGIINKDLAKKIRELTVLYARIETK